MSQAQNTYTYAFGNGTMRQFTAYDEDGADFIAANTAALYGWGDCTLIAVSTRKEATA